MRHIFLILIIVTLVLSGCGNSSKSQESEEGIEKKVTEAIDVLMDVVNDKEECGALFSVASRKDVELDYSSITGFLASLTVKIAPDFIMGEVMNTDCEGILGGDLLNYSDASYVVDKFEMDEKDSGKAKLYVIIDLYNELEGIEESINRVYYFEKDGDDWLIYNSHRY